MRIVPLLLLSLFAPAAAVAQSRPDCAAAGTTLPMISRDSIGPLPTDISVQALRVLCPGARDTLYYEHEAVFPAVLVQWTDLSVMAVQAHMEEERFEALPPVEECPASFWVVSGTGGRLSGGVPLSSTGAELRTSYGAPENEPTWEQPRTSWLTLSGLSFDLEFPLPEHVRGPPGFAVSRIWRVLVHPVAKRGDTARQPASCP